MHELSREGLTQTNALYLFGMDTSKMPLDLDVRQSV